MKYLMLLLIFFAGCTTSPTKICTNKTGNKNTIVCGEASVKCTQVVYVECGVEF